MIKCEKKDLDILLNYIGNDFGKCLYLYLDMLKYGFDNENINIWCQKKEDDIVLITLRYYNGMHVFTNNIDEIDLDDLINLIKDNNPNMVCGMGEIIRKLASHFKEYLLEVGYVGQLKKIHNYLTDKCILASKEELRDVALFLSKDESLGKPYGFDLLYKQLLERYNQNYGRTFILKENNEIIATASTYAEENKCAVVSGVLVDPKYRGKGLSKNILTALCKNLMENEFSVFSYYYIDQAIKMHKSVGFETLGEWAKLVKE